MLGKVVDVALPEHAGAVVGMEAQGHAALFGIGAHFVGHIAHFVQHLRVGGTLGGAVIAETGVLAVVPLAADGGQEVDLLLGDANSLFHVEGEVAVQVHQVNAALLGQVHQLLGILSVEVPDEGEVLHGVVAQEFALLEGLLQLIFGLFRILGTDPGPAGVCCFHR
ncbi:unknown [Clostridium sp. CAG:1013]|nr:unknown [Clostridium sp. CAG:1013]